MKQNSLFDDEPSPGAGNLPMGIPGSAPRLSKAQKLFNTLVRKIESQRELLRLWHDFVPVYQQRYADTMEPVRRRLAEKQRAMALLLDRAWDGPSLTKRERLKVRDLLLSMLADLLGESDDEVLTRLYDKHSDVSFEEQRQEDLGLAEALASEVFGVDLGDDHGARTPEELAALLGEKLRADQAARAEHAPPPRKKSPKAAAKEALQEKAREHASRSLREVYRKLVSELHPDREPDAAERARKTTLMQKVNEAYEASDLLALLELQLSIEQIDAAALAGLAEERLAHYNLVLKEQLDRLQDELNDVVAPFSMMLDGLPRRGGLTPADVLGSLDTDVRHLRKVVKQLEGDLAAFGDVRALKASLKGYRIGQNDDGDFDFEMLEALARAGSEGAPARRGKSRKR
jgi:hypothetical protein